MFKFDCDVFVVCIECLCCMFEGKVVLGEVGYFFVMEELKMGDIVGVCGIEM